MTTIEPTALARRSVLAAGVAGIAGAGLAAAAPARAAERAAPRPLALTHVTIVNPDDAVARPDTTVIIEGDRVLRTGPSRVVAVPAGATVVDLRGKYAIPGLADMHTHGFVEQIDPALYVANGVTTVREMSGTPRVRDWRTKIESGALLGPRYAIGSKVIDGAPSLWDPALLDVLTVADAEQGRAAVRRVVADGAEFVKVYSRVPPDALRGIAEEARAAGVPFVGHCPDEVPIGQAADLGQASFEHVFWTLFGTSRAEQRIRVAIRRIRLAGGDYAGWFKAIHPLEQLAVRTHSPAKAQALYDRFARRRSRHVPTLTMHRGLDHARTLDRDDPRNRYLPAPVIAGMNYALDELYLKDRAPSEDAGWAALYEHRVRLVGEMHRAGVPIMVGTDTGTCGMFPGFSVHEELRNLVDAGLSARDALRAATIEPAEFLGTPTGRIAPGRAADLVVLDENPLHDIAHTATPTALVVRGCYLDAARRQQILDAVERAAASTTAAPVTGCPCHGPLPKVP